MCHLFACRGDGHHAAGALPVDAHPGGRDRHAAANGRLPRDVAGLVTLLECCTQDHVLDLCRVQPRPVHRMRNHMGRKRLGWHCLKGAAIGFADGRTNGGDNDGVAHIVMSFLVGIIGLGRCPRPRSLVGKMKRDRGLRQLSNAARKRLGPDMT